MKKEKKNVLVAQEYGRYASSRIYRDSRLVFFFSLLYVDTNGRNATCASTSRSLASERGERESECVTRKCFLIQLILYKRV